MFSSVDCSWCSSATSVIRSIDRVGAGAESELSSGKRRESSGSWAEELRHLLRREIEGGGCSSRAF